MTHPITRTFQKRMNSLLQKFLILSDFQTLNIDWRPLARDSVFYAMSIVMFIVFAWDGVLELYECGILFFGYCLYVTTMFVNQPLMRFFSFLESWSVLLSYLNDPGSIPVKVRVFDFFFEKSQNHFFCQRF